MSFRDMTPEETASQLAAMREAEEHLAAHGYGFDDPDVDLEAVYGTDDPHESPAPCPTPACALLADHAGPHMTPDAEEFTVTTEGEPRPTETVVASLTRTFAAVPSEDPVKVLRVADAAFGVLDSLLRSGSPLPRLWRPRAASEGDGHAEVTTELYDDLSEALRFIGDPFDSNDALCAAGAMWRDLDGELIDGGPLPTPWQ